MSSVQNVTTVVIRFFFVLEILYDKSSAVAETGDRDHNRHGPKRRGRLLRPFREELGFGLIQCGLGRGLLPYEVVSSSIQPFGHNRVEPKTGVLGPFRGSCDPI